MDHCLCYPLREGGLVWGVVQVQAQGLGKPQMHLALPFTSCMTIEVLGCLFEPL